MVVLAVVAACRAEGGHPPLKPQAADAKSAPVKPVQTDVSAEDFVMPALPHTRVVLTDAFKGQHTIDCEVAATHDARTRGLMWRKALPEGTGMIFLFPQQSELSFWMRNTLIGLDMVFIDADFKIAGIVERAEPQTLTSRSPGKPAKYVLEIPAGASEKMGLTAGLPVRIDGLAGFAVSE